MPPRSSSTASICVEKGWPSSAALRKRPIGLGARHQLAVCRGRRGPRICGFIDLVICLGVALRRGLAQQLQALSALCAMRHRARHRDLEVQIVGVRGERHVATGAAQFVAPAQCLLREIFRRVFRQPQADFAGRFQRQRLTWRFGRRVQSPGGGDGRKTPIAAGDRHEQGDPRQRSCAPASAGRHLQESSATSPCRHHFAAVAVRSMLTPATPERMAGLVMDDPACRTRFICVTNPGRFISAERSWATLWRRANSNVKRQRDVRALRSLICMSPLSRTSGGQQCAGMSRSGRCLSRARWPAAMSRALPRRARKAATRGAIGRRSSANRRCRTGPRRRCLLFDGHG